MLIKKEKNIIFSIYKISKYVPDKLSYALPLPLFCHPESTDTQISLHPVSLKIGQYNDTTLYTMYMHTVIIFQA